MKPAVLPKRLSYHAIWGMMLVLLIASGCAPASPAVAPTSLPVTETPLLPTKALAAPSATTQPTPLPPTGTLQPSPTTSVTSTSTATSAETTPAPPLPAPGSVLTPTLTSLHMLDQSQGWGLTAQNVLRTSDGGISWSDVTPPGFGGPAYPQGFFLDTHAAWIIQPNGQDFYSGVLYRTLDAGKTWTSGKVPFSGASFEFLDTKNGWALFASDCGAGSCGGSLYHTMDGGLTWSELLKINQDSNDNPKAIPLSGDKSGITFADPGRGWVGGTEPVDDYTYLFATLDGGSTWQHVGLKLPTGFSPAQVMVDPPHFFSAKDGLLPIHIFSGNRSSELFYITQDAGLTWTPSSPTDISGVYSFISTRDIWVWDGQTMQVTKDGGETWEKISPNVNLSQTIMQLQFVTKEIGWVIAMDADGKGRLLKTQDGGKIWAPLH